MKGTEESHQRISNLNEFLDDVKATGDSWLLRRSRVGKNLGGRRVQLAQKYPESLQTWKLQTSRGQQ